MDFIKKYKVVLIVLVVIALFIVSLVLTPKTASLIDDKSVTEWFAKAQQDEITILTLAQTTCGHCISFKPTAEKFVNKYDIDWYWIDVDSGAKVQLSNEDIDILQNQFPDFTGTPYTVIVKGGAILDKINGEASYDRVLETVTKANGGELKER